MMMTQTSPSSLINVMFGVALLVAMALGGRALRAEPPVDFGRDVRPILSDNQPNAGNPSPPSTSDHMIKVCVVNWSTFSTADPRTRPLVLLRAFTRNP